MDRIMYPPPPASGHVCPALLWAEQNLTSLARHTAGRMDGGECDSVHLAATFALLRARQAVRSGIRDVERATREVRA